MGQWIEGLPVVWMALVVFSLTYLTAWAIHVVIMRLAVGERARSFKGITPSLLPPLGIIFGLFAAFVAAQVWSDTDRAKAALDREATALSTVVFLAASFPGEPEVRMRELTRTHILEVVNDEWPIMIHQSAALQITPPALAEELELAVDLTPHSEGQISAQRGIVSALENAIDARRQRIVVSQSSVNGVKWTALLFQAMITLIAIAMVHSDSRRSAASALGIFATAVAVAILLVASHDRPFLGQLAVKPYMLEQIMPEEAATQAEIDHTLLIHLTTLLHAAQQVISEQQALINLPKAGKELTGKKLLEMAEAKYLAQTGHPVPSLNPTSEEGEMLQDEEDAMREVMDQAQPLTNDPRRGNKGFLPAVFAAQVAERFNQKVSQRGPGRVLSIDILGGKIKERP